MEKIWRLLTAIFILCAVIAVLLLAYEFQNAVFSVAAVYAAILMIPVGIIKGVLVMIDYHREKKNEEPE